MRLLARRFLSLLSARSRRMEDILLELQRKSETMVTQADIDAVTARLTAIEARIPAPDAGSDLDLSALNSAVDKIEGHFPEPPHAPVG